MCIARMACSWYEFCPRIKECGVIAVVATWAHNPVVAGSIPAPATKNITLL